MNIPAEQAPSLEQEREIDALVEQIRKIGLARFVGRINAGLIETDAGYAAVGKFVKFERQRPLISRLTHLLTNRVDSFDESRI